MYNEQFMQKAIDLAKKAYAEDEVPVGAVVVKDNKIIGSGYNKREQTKNALMHAELIAINEACKNLSNFRLENCDIYVTLEPCAMCAGAIVNARIENLYFGAKDKRFGATGSKLNVLDAGLNHKVNYSGGYFESEIVTLLQEFFNNLRKRL
ncbi:MAG: tRNA adenosine(34) deaminase TadA [Clostridia bacterium]|nr:tRNA adenosine(34) deaminase TadA [Clostridia bacterium]